MIMLNLGCGNRTSPAAVNIDWGITLRLKQWGAPAFLMRRLMPPDKFRQYQAIPKDIMVHDLARGIPFPDASVDLVYHSHVIEHIDRQHVEGFLAEIYRVLKPGGLHRIVAPDLALAARAYLDHLAACEADPLPRKAQHDPYVATILEQCVRKEAAGTSQRAPWRRAIENAVLGDARKRGETHQWMYDRFNLGHLLERTGFTGIAARSFDASAYPGWNAVGLDRAEDGGEYIPGSLYLEAIRPRAA
jgi:SAM-dependent methyltransferase